jgi:hypothetical protein
MMIRICFLFLFMLVCVPVNAQVFVEQGKVNLPVHPGEHVSDTVTVHNTTGKSVKARIYWEDFSYQPPFDGAKKFAPASTLKTSLAKWIQFSPRDLVLPAFGKVNISYSIDVPSNAQGGYYGVLFVEPQNSDLSGSDKGVRIITRVGCLFFVETGDRSKNASVNEVFVNGNILKGRLHNQGNVVLLPQSSYYIMDREGLATDRGELKKYYLPPGESVDFELPLGRDISPGEYTLVLTFDLQDGDVLVKEIELTKNSDIEYKVRTIRD